MATDRTEFRVNCPFFKTIETHNIGCEGFTHNSMLVQRFRSIEERKEWQSGFCETDYKNCPLHNFILREKYD